MHKKWHINFESYFAALKIPQIGQQGRRNSEPGGQARGEGGVAPSVYFGGNRSKIFTVHKL